MGFVTRGRRVSISVFGPHVVPPFPILARRGTREADLVSYVF